MRRTIEVIVETEELLIVNGRRSAMPLKCPACGAAIEPLALGAIAARPTTDASQIPGWDSSLGEDEEGEAGEEKPQADFRPIRQLLK